MIIGTILAVIMFSTVAWAVTRDFYRVKIEDLLISHKQRAADYDSLVNRVKAGDAEIDRLIAVLHGYKGYPVPDDPEKIKQNLDEFRKELET